MLDKDKTKLFVGRVVKIFTWAQTSIDMMSAFI